MSKRTRLRLYASDEDRERLDMICRVHNLSSRSAAMRIALAALCRELGIENDLPKDIIK